MSYPLIGCTAYEKIVHRDPDIMMSGISTPYKNAIIAAGGIPVLVPQNLDEAKTNALLDRLDGLLVPGGGDIEPTRYGETTQHATVRGIDPERDAFEAQLVHGAVERALPLLAICRGHQVLNVALGGTLWQDVQSQMPDAARHDFYEIGVSRNHLPHHVSIEPDSKLAQLLGTTDSIVNSIHHQGVRDLGDGLIATAYAEDGLIEGIELPTHRFMVGVQWHPEEIVDDVPEMWGLFKGLVAAAQAVKA